MKVRTISFVNYSDTGISYEGTKSVINSSLSFGSAEHTLISFRALAEIVGNEKDRVTLELLHSKFGCEILVDLES